MPRGTVRERSRPPTSAERASGRFPHPFAFTWRDGLFLHWPIDPDELRPHVPEPLTLDTWNGRAWVSVLPFVLARAGLRMTPKMLRMTAPELNVRTYVTCRGDPGLYFFSVDVDSAAVATVAGRLTRLPVSRARMHVSRVEGSSDYEGNRVSFSSTRESADEPPARLAVNYEPDEALSFVEPDSRDAWLTERRRFYAPDGRGVGNVLVGEVAHAPWPLQSASVTLSDNTLFAANGLPEPDGDPIARYCPELAMTASIPRRVRGC
ncbi:YqjF family protein [Halovivax gelatinilyticus]|uniref:YqjF family protein n=1 Tax=Halovivax gelatinilyticus TaxID=2961597 RepID=UPI0020CA4E78|nr:DUF2071 domain-containing protein [Halovivax gelatinilyticus]